jgi:hypothetical protein
MPQRKSDPVRLPQYLSPTETVLGKKYLLAKEACPLLP